MANVQDVKTPNEILIRWSDDGVLKGAHVVFLHRISIDGEVVKTEMLPAEPLDTEGFPTSALMDETTKQALVQVTTLNKQIAELHSTNLQLREQLSEAQHEVERLNARLQDSVPSRARFSVMEPAPL